MFAQFEKFSSGWIGISLAINNEQISELILRLNELKSGRLKHFHFRTSDFSAEQGIADIEISVLPDEASSNMTIE